MLFISGFISVSILHGATQVALVLLLPTVLSCHIIVIYCLQLWHHWISSLTSHYDIIVLYCLPLWCHRDVLFPTMTSLLSFTMMSLWCIISHYDIIAVSHYDVIVKYCFPTMTSLDQLCPQPCRLTAGQYQFQHNCVSCIPSWKKSVLRNSNREIYTSLFMIGHMVASHGFPTKYFCNCITCKVQVVMGAGFHNLQEIWTLSNNTLGLEVKTVTWLQLWQ